MQVCPKCGARIKYIATGYDEIATCEISQVEVLNERGHKFKGYPLHICRMTDNNEQKDKTRSR